MVLIFTLGMLTLLSLLAVVYLTVSAGEAAASMGFVDGVRARGLALSGLEYGIARLRRDAGTRWASDPAAPWRYGGGPLETTPAPSYRGGVAHGHTYSTLLPGTYLPQGDQAVLKILDTGAQIHLNAPMPALAMILDHLGRGIADHLREQSLPAVDPIAGRGAQIVALRDAQGGLGAKESLLPLLGESDYRRVEDYLSVEAWIDPSVIAPTGGMFPEGHPAHVLEPRAPVNVNLAPKPVLAAVLAGLRGPAGGAIPYAIAWQVAEAIDQHRTSLLPTQGPFKGWREFYDFVQSLTQPPSVLLTPEWAWVILANADPNYHSVRLNPERVIALPVDKTDLLTRTTEFCFREMGLYEITSLGRVFFPGPREAASAKLVAVVRVFDILYHTTQAQFESRRSTTGADHTATWPNAPPAATGVPADWAGHVQLQTDVPAVPPGHPAPAFEALLRTSLDADSATGPPGAQGDQERGADVAWGADLLPEGLLFSDSRMELSGWTCSGNAEALSGAVEFWVKFDERSSASLIPVYLATFPATSEVGVQHRIRTAISSNILTVESTRLFYVADTYGPPTARAAFPCPYLYEETTATAVLIGRGQAHEWHHIAVRWEDGTQQTLYVDGVQALVTSVTPASATMAFTGWPPHRDLVTLGGSETDERGREVTPGTFDDLRFFAQPGVYSLLGFMRSRFEDVAPTHAGVFEGAFAPLPYPARLLGVSHTEWVPETYNGLPLADLPASLDLGLDVGSGMIPLPAGPLEDVLALLGLGVVVENQEIRYRITFKHTPTVLPLNVTPVFDDLTIAFAPNRVTTVRFRWVNDG